MGCPGSMLPWTDLSGGTGCAEGDCAWLGAFDSSIRWIAGSRVCGVLDGASAIGRYGALAPVSGRYGALAPILGD